MLGTFRCSTLRTLRCVRARGFADRPVVQVRELPSRAALPNGGFPSLDDSPVDITAMEVFAAAHRIRQGNDGVKRTSMYHSRRLSAMLGMEIYLKHEFTHPTGSFKERGGCVHPPRSPPFLPPPPPSPFPLPQSLSFSGIHILPSIPQSHALPPWLSLVEGSMRC